jgi:hypothetical protein
MYISKRNRNKYFHQLIWSKSGNGRNGNIKLLATIAIYCWFQLTSSTSHDFFVRNYLQISCLKTRNKPYTTTLATIRKKKWEYLNTYCYYPYLFCQQSRKKSYNERFEIHLIKDEINRAEFLPCSGIYERLMNIDNLESQTNWNYLSRTNKETWH